jgi:hypothetical protein
MSVANLSEQELDEMREMLAGLSAEERETLFDPIFITEDESDSVWSGRSMREPSPSIPASEIFAEFCYTPRRRTA